MIRSILFGLVAFIFAAEAAASSVKSGNIKYHEGISREEKWKNVGHKGITLWMTGLSGSGKSTVSVALERALVQKQPKSYFVYRLDGDNLRFGLNRDLGFAPDDRKENVRRVSEVARSSSPRLEQLSSRASFLLMPDREYAREVHFNASLPFMEVFIDAPLSVVEDRDPKGLYKKAREGKIKGFTGIDAPYDRPEHPEVHIRTDLFDIAGCVNAILDKLDEAGLHLQRSFQPMPDDEPACSQ